MNPRILSVGATLAILFGTQPADARFLKPDLEKVQVDRLIKNLNEQLGKELKTGSSTRYNLARLHAMAYALKTDSVDVQKKRGPGDGPWFGFTPGVVPFKAVDTDDKNKAEAAKKHLEKAIANYKELLKEKPGDLPALLGLAWCIEQSGEKEEAIKAYRDVLDKGWDIDRKKKTGPLGGNFITKEAGGYLIPLLDAKKDAEEIESIKQRIALLNKLPRPVTPIAVPLRDGLTAQNLEDRSASVAFDVDGTGIGRRWSWINRDAAWLVHDPNHSGKITSGLDLFGNVTFWCFWQNGYEALRSLDDNGDGMLDGAELRGLALWHDANGDGVCDSGEVRPLAHFGIIGISCESEIDTRHPDRINYSPRGVHFRGGATRPTFDLILQSK